MRIVGCCARTARRRRARSHRWCSAVVVAALASIVLVCCAHPPAPPRQASLAAASCPWTPAPLDDPTRPAVACGVAPLDLTAPLARHADRLPVSVQLYTDRVLTCLPSTAGCAVEDSRRFVTAPAPDPRADPSRTRALLTFDWTHDQAQLHVPPRCHLRGGPGSTIQDCLDPARRGSVRGLDHTRRVEPVAVPRRARTAGRHRRRARGRGRGQLGPD